MQSHRNDERDLYFDPKGVFLTLAQFEHDVRKRRSVLHGEILALKYRLHTLRTTLDTLQQKIVANGAHKTRHYYRERKNHSNILGNIMKAERVLQGWSYTNSPKGGRSARY